MRKLTQVMAAARRFAVWLLPAEQRDWAAVIGLFMSILAAGFANHPPYVRSPGPGLAMTSGE